MGYSEKSLAPNERILFRARYHWVFYRFPIIVLILALALAIAAYTAKSQQAWNEVGRPLVWIAAGFAAIALAAFAMLRFANLDEFVVTNRVIRKVGHLPRDPAGAGGEGPGHRSRACSAACSAKGRIERASEKGMLVFRHSRSRRLPQPHLGPSPSRTSLRHPAAPQHRRAGGLEP
jgi:hypothetical protein